MEEKIISGCKVHCLKIWHLYYEAVANGSKPFEVRKHDRKFAEGDILELQEYNPRTKKYSGRFTRVQVTYILLGGQFGVEAGYCVMGIERLPFDKILINK